MSGEAQVCAMTCVPAHTHVIASMDCARRKRAKSECWRALDAWLMID